MAERGDRNGQRPEEGTPEYDWLYGTQRRGVGSDGNDRPRANDPEPTRVMPTMDRPGSRSPQPDARRPPGGMPPADRSTPPAGPAGRPPSAPQGPEHPRGRPVGPGRPGGRRRHPARWVVLVLLLWVVYLVAVPIWAWTNIDKVAFEPKGDRPGDQPGTTYLLVGSDSRADLTPAERRELGTGQAQGRRTDTIMLLHTGSGPNLLMSIPRDSIVAIPGHSTTKINAAYAWGGPKLLVKTVEGATGIRIDDYVEIGFGGFVKLVDAVGGIQICPTQAMNDPLANLRIKKGCQHVDGRTALGYSRSRHTSNLGDIDRARHQREVVSAVGSKAVSPWSVLNPFRYYHLADAGSQALTVGKGTGPLDTVQFAWAMTRVNGEKGLTCGVPIADLAVHWDQDRAEKLFELIKQDHTDQVSKDLCGESGLKNQ